MAQEQLKGLLSGGEVILIDTRQHWMALVRFALKPILLIGLAALLVLLNQWLNFDGFLAILNDLIHVFLVVAFLVAVVWLPIDVVRWRSRHFVLTNRRAMRMAGVIRKTSFDASIEQINDIALTQSIFGRSLGYADLTLLTASDSANESYAQLMDGLQFKRAVLDAKEGIRVGRPLKALAEGFIVKGGTNVASMRADGKLEEAAMSEGGAANPSMSDGTDLPFEPVTAEVLAQRSDPGSGGGEGSMAPAPPAAMPVAPPAPEYVAPPAPAEGAAEMAAAENQAARQAAAWPASDTAPSGTDKPSDDGAPKS